MNKLRDKLKTKSFWVSLAGLLALLLSRCGAVAEATVSAVVEGVAGVLIALGLIAAPAAPSQEEQAAETAEEEKEESGEDPQA